MQNHVVKPKMDRNPNPLPQSPSGNNSIWTVDGSQQQLASAINNKPIQNEPELRIFTNTSKKRLEAFLIFSIFVISLLVIALSISIYLVADDGKNPKICSSPSCLRTASSILISMNESQNPCDNFYNYVCGNFRMEHAMPEPYWENNWFRLRDVIMTRDIRDFLLRPTQADDPLFLYQARNFYGTCLDFDLMQENGLETFWDVLKKTDLPKDIFKEPKTTDWIKSIAKVRRYIGINLLLGVFVAPSILNSTQNQIFLSTPSQIDIMIPGFNWDFDKSSKIIEKMISGEDDVFKSIWTNQGSKMMEYVVTASGGEYKEDEVKDSIFNVLTITRNFSQFENSPNISKSIANEIPEVMTFEELQAYVDEQTESKKSKLDIITFIQTLYENDDIKIDFKNDKLIVHQKQYFGIISEFLEQVDDKDLGLYIWWNVIYSLAPHVNEDLALLKTRFVSKLLGDYPIETRSAVCLDTVRRLMAPAVGYFMVNKTKDETVNNVKKLILNVKNVFAKSINSLTWMDRRTKESSIEKLFSINDYVGVPEGMKNLEEIEDMYNITFEDEYHLKNMMALIELQNNEVFGLLELENDLNVSYFDPLMINAFYDPSTNAITVPAGIIQFPFYDLGTESLNYGAIGTILGHELTHGFDNIGRRYDKVGNVHTWWSNNSIEQYTNRTICYEKEFDSFVIPYLNASVNGKFTLAENLADDGGIKFAYNAYKEHAFNKDLEPKPPGLNKFTHDQLFFISFANIWCSETSPTILLQLLGEDEHSPDFARVNIALQNFEPFAEAWECMIGSDMNPKKKCRMWD